MEDIINELESLETFSFDKSFDLAQMCSSLLKTDEASGRRLIINVLNNWSKIHPSTTEIWTDLIEASGFYPYLQKNVEFIRFRNLSGELRKEIHLSKNLRSKYFHDEQFTLLGCLAEPKNVIVSAPTSFGKSLLIEELVASKRYKNIVVIQPTLALLDETRKKLLTYKNDYKLIVRTSQVPSDDRGNIFLFTAERVNEYKVFPSVDFLVIDEFYKLSGNRDDERSSSLNNAFYYLLKTFNPKFYLLGPNIDAISAGFAERYNATFFRSDYTLVDSRSINLYDRYKNQFGHRGEKKLFKEDVLFKLLLSLNEEQTIIYCSSPNRVRYLAKRFSYFLNVKKIIESSTRYPLIEWINESVGGDWCLIDYLKYDIGIHDGALQKHISTSLIDYFNTGKLKYLFCTSTIIEGVNTSAKNIIYFDSNRGQNHPIDFFDYSNIKGRAGRLMEHYVGRIFNFNKPPENVPIIIDIPFHQQNPIKNEVLIQLDPAEVINIDTDQYKSLAQLPDSERQVIKQNGVHVNGQKAIIDVLRRDLPSQYFLVDWKMPDYRQLEYILGLAWDHLLVPGETTRPMTKKKLINMTFNYGISQDIDSLINSAFHYYRGLKGNHHIADNELRDRSIQETFQIMKHWFEYKVPKWLSVLNEIQRFICIEKGLRPASYTHYANLIENDFLRQNLSILAEYGIPSSAIRKMEKNIPSNLDQDLVLAYIKTNEIYNLPNLLEYEKQKVKENTV